MTLHDQTILKLQHLPEPLVQEVSNFIDYLLWKNQGQELIDTSDFTESLELTNSDFSNYLSNLENYENRLARGEIKW